jgi:hypothetical protein
MAHSCASRGLERTREINVERNSFRSTNEPEREFSHPARQKQDYLTLPHHDDEIPDLHKTVYRQKRFAGSPGISAVISRNILRRIELQQIHLQRNPVNPVNPVQRKETGLTGLTGF